MKLAALQQNPQQEYRQRKLDLIGKAFSFILSGISWLSVNLTELKLIAYTLGLLFLGIAIYVISATYKAMDCTPMVGQIRLGESGRVIHCSPE
jgi:ABC-type Co2+ transport system permease subunit